MAARNDLIVLNQGRDFTFRRGAGGLIIDLKFAAPRLTLRIVDWCVLQVITLSDHQCIEFSIDIREGAAKKKAPLGTQDDSAKTSYKKHREETRLIDELGWAKSAGSLEDTVWAARRKVVAACDHSMPSSTSCEACFRM